MSLEIILSGVLAAILAGFGLYWKGKAKGEKETKAEVAEQKVEETKVVTEDRIEKVKAASDAQAEVNGMSADDVNDRLFDEFNRDR